jgi:hypothetical protein
MKELKANKKAVNKATPLLKIKDTSTHVNPARPLDLDALLRASKVKVKGKKLLSTSISGLVSLPLILLML